MKKLLTAFAVMASLSAPSQTLFYYGKDSVSVNEFLKAYHKNNTAPKTPKAFTNYLDLYINSRLKIKEAQELGYDTLPQIVSDIAALRQQILPMYLNDKENVDRMAAEAFTRSQKDIHLAHLFFSFKDHPDTAALAQRVKEASQELSARPFAEVARRYSDDPAASANGGDLGWITVFSLPYELENLAYSLAPGKTSGMYRSRAGYHIFKNLGERKATGKVRAAQILLSFPPGANEVTRSKTRKLADSIYNSLLRGADFGKLAAQYSNDAISAAANGEMQDFGVGEYDKQFEDKVFALPKDGAITAPFETAHGFHIVKRIARIAIPSKADAKTMQLLREKTERSDRMNTARSALAKKVIVQTGFHKNNFSTTELWALSDSLINYQTPKQKISMTIETPLATFRDKKLTAADWISYAQMYRYKADGSGIKPYPQIWDEFIESSALDYYQNNLEQFNEDFRQQIAEFVDGNLFFEIMQRQVWGPAQSDTAALEHYFKQHAHQYTWKNSADAVLFYGNDPAATQTFRSALSKNPLQWRSITADMSEKIAADSGRFELEQIPSATKIALHQGLITSPVLNKTDNTSSFAYIIQMHPKPEPRNFNEARGLVINDYQNDLEKTWIESLRKKYPVRVNKELLDDLLRSSKP